MRHFIIAIAIAAMGIPTNAQDTTKTKDHWHTRFGFVFTPQAGISLSEPEKGFETFYTLIADVVFIKGNVTLVPFYGLMGERNSIGHAGIYRVSDQLKFYNVLQKNLTSATGYVSVGAMTPVFDGKFNAFAELGTNLPGWSPMLYTGVFIGLTRPFKEKPSPK